MIRNTTKWCLISRSNVPDAIQRCWTIL